MKKKKMQAVKRLHAEFCRKVDRGVGKRLAEGRALEGKKQEDIGGPLGIGGPAVSRYEAGVTSLSVGTLVAMAHAIGSRPSAMLVDFDSPGAPRERALTPEAVALAHVFDSIKNGGLRQIVRGMADKLRSHERIISQEKFEQ